MRQVDIVLVEDRRPADAPLENVGVKIGSVLLQRRHGLELRISPRQVPILD